MSLPRTTSELERYCDELFERGEQRLILIGKMESEIARLTAQLAEKSEDAKRLDWLEEHVEELTCIRRPLNDTLTLQYVCDETTCIAEEECVTGLRDIIDAARKAQK